MREHHFRLSAPILFAPTVSSSAVVEVWFGDSSSDFSVLMEKDILDLGVRGYLN
jgi:hypothetical protein